MLDTAVQVAIEKKLLNVGGQNLKSSTSLNQVVSKTKEIQQGDARFAHDLQNTN